MALTEKHRRRIEAGREVILRELQPSQQQLERGLQLHRESFVADTQGGVPVSTPVGWSMERLSPEIDRLRADLRRRGLPDHEVDHRVTVEWKRRKTFESAFDDSWHGALAELSQIAGVNLGSEDVAHPNENDFDAALVHIVRNLFIYERTGNPIRITGGEELERCVAEGTPGIVQHMAGVGAFAEAEDPIRNLDLFYALGVRMMQLTYIQRNRLCCSWMQQHDQGLTDLGRQAVERMNQLGIMVDIAHCGERSALEIIAASDAPVLLSHTGCRAIYDDASNDHYLSRVLAQPYARGVRYLYPTKTGSRNAGDAVLKGVAGSGGVVSILVLATLLEPPDRPTGSFAAFARHLEHAVEVAGVDHVAIGSDTTFFPDWPPASMDWTNWPYWTVGLVCRGFADDEIRKLIGGNYVRYCRDVLPRQPWGPFI